MLDTIYHRILKLFKTRNLGVKRQYFTIFIVTLYWTSLGTVTQSLNHYFSNRIFVHTNTSLQIL